MNKTILKSALVLGIAAGITSCSENSWNDHYLKGFESGVDYNQPSKTEETYTLTSEDYAAIAKQLTAEATTDEQKAAAKAIGANLYFDKNSVYPAPVALPVFMKTTSFPYYLDAVGTNVALTYTEAGEVPAEITAISAASTYKVTDTDYQEVWESTENYVASFTPSHTAASELPGILKSALPNASEGDYAVVSYNSAPVDPVFNAEGDVPSFQPTDILGGLEDMVSGDELEIAGVVMAVSTQGPIVADATGAVFTYSPTNNNDLKVGDQVKISSTLGSYNYAWQLVKGSTPEVVGSQSVTYPTPRTWTGAEIDQFVADKMATGATLITPIYSTLTGKAIISGNYINISLDGTTVQLSPYGASAAVKAAIADGATVTLEGYVMAIASKGKYLNMVITKVDTQSFSTLSTNSNKVVKIASTAENAVYYNNGSKWVEAEGIAILNPADYKAMGVDNEKLTDATTYLPMYLKNKFPYALEGDMEYVVYNGTKCDLFVFNGTAWELNNNGRETVTARFTKKANGWSFVKYLGKAVFNAFNEEQLILDRSYLIVCGDQAATPVSTSKNYGYLTAVAVPVNNGTVVLSNDAYAFTFESAYVNEEAGVNIKAPEGTFLFRDSNGRYLYLTGGYNSPNLTDAPVINDGQINEQYLFTATHNEDGKWVIVRGDRTLHLSTNYGSYGFYQPAGTSDLEILPELYILD